LTRKAFKPARSKDLSSDDDFLTTSASVKDPFESLKQMQKSLALKPVKAEDKKSQKCSDI
jgi:hypothetical protein